MSEERKNQILEAVIARAGFQHTHMDDIASQAGLSKGTRSLYYKSKDAVIPVLFKRFFRQEFMDLQRGIPAPREESTTGQLLLLTHQLSSAMQWMEKLMPIAFEFYALAGRNREVRLFLREYFQDYRTALARLNWSGVEHSEGPAADPEVTATTLFARYKGLALLYFVDPGALQRAEQAEHAVCTLLQGVLLQQSDARSRKPGGRN
jgi:AcrR family transcriptional regulator